MTPGWLEKEIVRIKASIEREGSFVATMQDMNRIFGYATFDVQFQALVRLAQQEHWVFTFFPDRRVEIKPYEEAE